MSIEAMKMALRTLIEADKGIVPGGVAGDIRQVMKESIKALRQAIEQAEKQGIITYRIGYESGYMDASVAIKREWVGLTGKEINKLYDKHWGNGGFEYERAIEAKLKEKNT